MEKTKLFLIPYAGGLTSCYAPFRQYIGDNVQLVPIELKGRGPRMIESMYSNIPEAVEDVYNIINKQVSGNYAIYGHSMGAQIGFEVERLLESIAGMQAVSVFLSGHYPSVGVTKDKYCDMTVEKLKKFMADCGGTNSKVFDIPELMNNLIPQLCWGEWNKQ